MIYKPICLPKGTFYVLSGLLLFYGLFLSSPCKAERYSPQLETDISVDHSVDIENDDFVTVESLNTPLSDSSLEKIPTIKGNVDVEKEFVPDVLFDEIHTLHKGEKLVLTIMDMVATGYSQNGDDFHARVKVAVERDGKILIPKGALVKGHIETTDEPGRALAKKGSIVLEFDYILMPDGRKIQFKSQFEKGDNAVKTIGRAVGSGIGGTIGGAIRGIIVGLRFGGIKGAYLTNGGTLIGGGGIGALAGLGRGLSRSGDHVILNEGVEIKVALEAPLDLPVIIVPPDTDKEIHAEGLNVKVTDYALGRDPFKVENLINLKLSIDNQTELNFGSFDIALMDEYDNTYFVSPFGNQTRLVFQIPSKSQLTETVSFSVRSPDLKHYLIFYKPFTRDVMAKVSLTEALKNLSSAKSKTNITSRKTNKG